MPEGPCSSSIMQLQGLKPRSSPLLLGSVQAGRPAALLVDVAARTPAQFTTYSVVIRTYGKGEMFVRALLLFSVQLLGLESKCTFTAFIITGIRMRFLDEMRQQELLLNLIACAQ